ncbi:MAG: zinc-dependent dehydrogenase [Desulfitobacteriaceae bacterium]
MLAARLYGKNDIRLEEVKIPEINGDEILLKVKGAAICGTDIRMYKNGSAGINAESPRILGHELSGVIAAVGKNVRGFQEGMRVAVAPNMGCGVCNACVRGEGHLCKDYRALGINLDGGFAEYTVIPGAAVSRGNMVEIDEHVSFDEAAINEPLSCVYNGLEKCNTRPGDNVLIIGAGPIGIMHAKLAKMAGAARVFINDLSQERLDVCKEIEPSLLTVKSEQLVEYIMETTKGEGVDVCITACPAPAAQITALELAAVNGRVCFFGGLPPDRQNVSLNTNLIHYKQLMVTGSTRASLLQYRKTLGFISSGLLDVKKLITSRLPLSEIAKGFELAADAKGLKNVMHVD